MPPTLDTEQLLEFDKRHLWHPYSSMAHPLTAYPVAAAEGAILTLEGGTSLIDGMSSWWSAIHGYQVAEINAALRAQIDHFSHVMFGGLTHRPAVELAQRLIALTPPPLQHIFLADSGSIAVEVALKMALQYWMARGEPERCKLAVLRGGYHGDTFATMALADPDNGMHTLFQHQLPSHHFIPRPSIPFGAAWEERSMEPLQQLLEQHHSQLAALILEPVVQGAGGMYFYHPKFLQRARALCDHYQVLLIADEIATGFGRSGELLACDHAGVVADILCIGKALTGGTLSLAATLTTEAVATTLSSQGSGTLMHGPTFMANPLACSAANASIDLLLRSPWRQRVQQIEAGLRRGLAPCRSMAGVKEVRILGAIGVVEMREAVDLNRIQPLFIEQGVWVRPFGRLIYLMPPFVIEPQAVEALTRGVVEVVSTFASSATRD
ncbi:MAG: adenosylmethionine--8-amino-7-oxononanoate transaminase [Gammaproteobacteria bacterium]|nr:adenosylmethionine--8-amino-7-oxononanoate transaminase [Gammaproteobacteria bacterium]MBT7306887.1 adenosylmethionine--8-amino-7-oxononanoate transaminase [Gammaproteobacteria bacterium]